jgi:hypothetical protein
MAPCNQTFIERIQTHQDLIVDSNDVDANAWVSRATAKPPTSWARPAELLASSQAQNAAAVASVATTNEGGPHFPRKKQ